jgi:hypothetical protein
LPTAIEGARELIKKHMLVDTVETSTRNAKNIKNFKVIGWKPIISYFNQKKDRGREGSQNRIE